MPKATQETADKAKSLGIKGWHLKKEETLLDEIASIENAVDDVISDAEAVPKSKPVKEAPKPAETKTVDLIDLIEGKTWDQAMISIKCLAQKSPFWIHKAKIEEKLRGD